MWRMASVAGEPPSSAALSELSERQRRRAFDRYGKIRLHLERDVPLARVAREAALPLRTAQRWVSRYRQFGLAGLIRAGRADRGKRRRLSEELRRLAEGLALQRPPLGPTAVYREVCRVARRRSRSRPAITPSTMLSALFLMPSRLLPSTARKPTAKPMICCTAGKPSAPIRSGKPITPSSTSGRNAMTDSRDGRG